MKRNALVSLFLTVIVSACCQTVKTFDCKYFTVDYPSSYKESPIINAPHMVLKLEGKKDFFSISRWNNKYAEGTTVWDDKIYSHMNNTPDYFGKVISTEKVLLPTRNGELRFVVQKVNTSEVDPLGKRHDVRAVTYTTIFDGHLVIITATREGKWMVSTPCAEYEKIIRNILFKESPEPYAEYDEAIRTEVETLDELCPLRVSDCAELRSVFLEDKMLTFSYVIDDDCTFLTDDNTLKEEMCEELTTIFKRSNMTLLAKTGYSFVFLYHNQRGIVIKRIAVTGHEVLKYY